MSDRLHDMFVRQEAFMKALVASGKDKLPSQWPVPVQEKASQQLCRDIMLRSVEEQFEALQHLKNWKPHKSTEVKDVNAEELLEEYVDALKFQFEFLILLGFTSDDLYRKFVEKDDIIHRRLTNGY